MYICHQLPFERFLQNKLCLSLESPLIVPQLEDQEISVQLLHTNGWATSILLIEVPYTTRWRCEWRKRQAAHARRSWTLGRCLKRTNSQTLSWPDEKDDRIQNWASFRDFRSTPGVATRPLTESTVHTQELCLHEKGLSASLTYAEQISIAHQSHD
jgi:hypothetical protein